MIQNRPESHLRPAGLLLIGMGAVAADWAWLSMHALTLRYGAICGTPSLPLAHCPACYASAALLLAGATCLALPAARRAAA